MDIEIKEYQHEDKDSVLMMMEHLQDYVVDLDPIQRIRRMPGYGENTFTAFQEYLSKNEGKCFVAVHENTIIGFIAGLIALQSEKNLLSVIPTRLGVVKELFIKDSHRFKNIGKQLMSILEEYFKKSGCDSLWVDVFAYNHKAHEFYKGLGYSDREIGMLKKIV